MPRKTDEKNPSDWFHFAEERINSADALWKTQGLTYTGVEALQEGTERFLKGYLIAKGWPLRRTHDLGKLIKEACVFDVAFKQFLPFADELTVDFFAQHYPGADIEEVGKNYEKLRQEAEDLFRLIRSNLPQFFLKT